MIRQFSYGSRTISYCLEHVPRKTLAITVHPDGHVQVRAPLEAELPAIERLVRKRAPWILRQQRHFAQFHPRATPRRYVGGETHLYLGRQYRLRLRADENEGVKLVGSYIWITLPDPSDIRGVECLLDRWYEAHARKYLAERFAACLREIAEWGVPPPELRITRMTRRWGSCSAAGRLTLNRDLIRAPRPCIDYVIFHELCHLRHRHHKTEFYRLLATLLPDWQARKQHLERLLASHIATGDEFPSANVSLRG